MVVRTVPGRRRHRVAIRARSDPNQSEGPLEGLPGRRSRNPAPAFGSLCRPPPLPSPAPPGAPERGGLLFGGTHYSLGVTTHGVTEDYDPALSAATNEGRIEPDILRIPVGPGAVHVERYGHGGTPIILLHGFGTCGFLWRTVAAALAEARHTAIAVDLLGYGESDRPLDTDFGIAAQAEYVERALAALRLPHAAVAGIDLGGAVATRLAATHPGRVSHLILINSLTADSTPADDVRALQRNTARHVLRVATGVLGVTPLLTPVLDRSVADPAHMPWRLVARYLAPYVGQDGVRHLLALAASVNGTDLEGLDLAALPMPTLIIRGESDAWLDDTVAERLAAAIPQSQLIRIPDAGRLIPEDAPEELTRLIHDFVRLRKAATPAR
jgi:pimeloyl-ACP methyl ester carboxylesterase